MKVFYCPKGSPSVTIRLTENDVEGIKLGLEHNDRDDNMGIHNFFQYMLQIHDRLRRDRARAQAEAVQPGLEDGARLWADVGEDFDLGLDD
jgi:hypothetical protein